MYIEDQDLGKVKLIVNARARRVIVRYRDGEYQLTHPAFISQEEIKKSIEQMKPKLLGLKERQAAQFVFTEETTFSTLTFDVSLKQNSLSNVYTSLKDEVLHITYPQSILLEDDVMQKYIKDAIEKFCRSEANRILPERIAELAEKCNFEVGEVKINKSRGRWGSCSTKKNINLSYFCMMLPQHLVDFVILHELCHTKEMNHGPRFWAWLDSVTENRAQELTQELKMIKLKW